MGKIVQWISNTLHMYPISSVIMPILVAVLAILIYDAWTFKFSQFNRLVNRKLKERNKNRFKIDIDQFVEKYLNAFKQKINLELERANVDFTVEDYMKYMFYAMGIGIFAGLVLFPLEPFWYAIFAWLPYDAEKQVVGRILEAAGFVYAGFMFPRFFFKFKINKRKKLAQEQLPDALSNLADTTKAGGIPVEAIQMVGMDMPYPLGPEFDRAYNEMKTGKSFSQALDAMKDRIDLADFSMAVSALEIQNETGGDLEVLLRHMSWVINERSELRREIEKTIAGPKQMGYVLLASPFFFLVIFSALNKDTYLQMLHNPIGILLLLIGLVSWGIAAFIIIYILRDVEKDI